MRKQELWVCEFCGTQYKDKEKAGACEKNHRVAMKIKNESHHAGGDYPDRVEVVFDNGKSVWYKR